MVVLRLRRADLASLGRAARALRERPEAGGPIGLVLEGATPELARSVAGSGLFDAVVLAGLEPSQGASSTAPRAPVLVLGRSRHGDPPGDFSERAARALGAPPLERWYRAPAAWPDEAWRDAAEWLAGVLGARGPVA